MTKDPSFAADKAGLKATLQFLQICSNEPPLPLPDTLPSIGIGETSTLKRLAPIVLGQARRLGSDVAFAHMDPPTPWITWAMAMWNASLNQNLLHPDVAPIARDLEAQTIHWLAPYFGMNGGHMTPGSTVSNLTALWAARELKGVTRVVASEAAHVSIAKSAHLLCLDFLSVRTDTSGRLDPDELPADLGRSALVLTAGTTSTGAIDDLSLSGQAAWTHVDAAWAGPLRLSSKYATRLKGIDKADSVAVSAHKWLFQPKESGLLFFKDVATAHDAISFGANYLAVPNVGLLGSHGAVAVPLLATLLAWGKEGLESRINRTMELAERLRDHLVGVEEIDVFSPTVSGVLLWRDQRSTDVDHILLALPPGTASRTIVDGKNWVRHVAANPNMKLEQVLTAINNALLQTNKT